MSINTIAVSQRNLPFNARTTANGSYTLPQHAFIPHPSLQALSGGMVPGPTNGLTSAAFATVPGAGTRALPIPNSPSVYGVRSVQVKNSP